MFKLNAYAKINCGLNVLGRRPDGYHNIESIFIGIDLADEVLFETSASLDVRCTPEVTPVITSNLAYRAADLYRQTLNDPNKGAKIVLSKSIPAGGGLGGGSSNAAAVLQGVEQLWQTKLDNAALALKLGSDVPYFLNNGIAYVTGRGEHVSQLKNVFEHENGPSSWYVLLVLPAIHINTSNAYTLLTRSSFSELQRLDTIFIRALGNKDLFRMRFENTFESVIFHEHPLLDRIKQQLYGAGAFYASMSGSGSAMYGLFDNSQSAAAARSVFPEHETYICRPLNAHTAHK